MIASSTYVIRLFRAPQQRSMVCDCRYSAKISCSPRKPMGW